MLVRLAVRAVGASLEAENSVPPPAGDAVKLRLGRDESRLNLSSFVGYGNPYEVWVLRRARGKAVEE